MIRTLIRRLHLGVAAVAGALILVLAATGALLSLEEAAAGLVLRRHYAVADRGGGARLAAAELAAAGEAAMGAPVTALRYRADPRAPVRAEAGRSRHAEVDGRTGEALAIGPGRAERFFAGVLAVHRWLAVPDGSVRRARMVTGAANVAFLFLLITGPALWLPWPPSRSAVVRGLVDVRWGSLRRGRAGASRAAGPGKAGGEAERRLRRALCRARSLRLHKVVGIWTVLPMAGLAVTGMATSYPAVGDPMSSLAGRVVGTGAGDVVGVAGVADGGDGVAGAEAAGGEAVVGGAARQDGEEAVGPGDPVIAAGPLDRALATAEAWAPGWRTLVVAVPPGLDGGGAADGAEGAGQEVRVEVLWGGKGQPQRAGMLTAAGATGAALAWESLADASPGRRGQEFLQHAHTGAYWGAAGRAIAGLAALAAALTAWTGMTLALDRSRRWMANFRGGPEPARGRSAHSGASPDQNAVG